MVRDGLREVEAEEAFLARWGGRLPESVRRAGPGGGHWEAGAVTEVDRRILEEGRHWGRFMRRFWDAGDRSIFDIRVKGTHPRFYFAGLLERDGRDGWRRWGFFTPRAGELLFGGLGGFAGRWAVDVGCGGGQFGLEAARRGVNVVGFDPSFEELALARRHAREAGVENIEYLRGEPAHPPLREGGFDLLMAKDSLHHVPELGEVFPRLVELLGSDGEVVIHEHVATARVKEWLTGRLRGPLVAKMQRRYPASPIPGELHRASANEDVSAHLVEEVVAEHFHLTGRRHDLYMAMEWEALFWFAFGKRDWLARIVYPAAAALEALLLLLGERQHVSMRGRRKGRGR